MMKHFYYNKKQGIPFDIRYPLLFDTFAVAMGPLASTSLICTGYCRAWQGKATPKILVGPGVLACATRGGGRSKAGHCFHLLFSFSFFFFFFFSAFYFSPTSGNLPCVKICLPQYFGITRRYMQKKIVFLDNFFPPQKKR